VYGYTMSTRRMCIVHNEATRKRGECVRVHYEETTTQFSPRTKWSHLLLTEMSHVCTRDWDFIS